MTVTLTLAHAAGAALALLAVGFVAGAAVMHNNFAWTKNIEDRVKRAAQAAKD